MAKQIGKKQRKEKSGGGAFWGGTFFGFVLCLLILFGVGSFVYFKVSPAWLNKTFKTDIDLGTKELNKLTLSEAVSHVISLTSNLEDYTLSDLKSDFGVNIPDTFKGIDISSIKNVPLTNIGEEIQTILSGISVYELEKELLTLNMDQIFEKENTYYFDSINTKNLYKSYNGTTFSEEVTDDDFKYSYDESNNKIVIKDQNIAINAINKEVKIKFKFLPLTYAISSFTSSLGENITLKELYDEYGVRLPDYIYNPTTGKNADKTINEVKDAIDALKVAEIIGWKISGSGADEKVYNDTNDNNICDANEEIKGVMKTVAKQTVNQLTSIQTTIDGLSIAEVLDLNIKAQNVSGVTKYYDDKNNNDTKDGSEDYVSYVLKSISETSVSSLAGKIDQLKLTEIFAPDELGKGVFSLMSAQTKENTNLNNLMTNITNSITGSKMGELQTAGLIGADHDLSKKIDKDEDGTPETMLSDMSIDEFFNYFLSL